MLIHCFTRTLLLRPRSVLLASLLAGLAGGCANYDFTFNEQPVGPTPKLAENIQVSDTRLAECVDRTVHDQRIGSLNQLTRLSCPQSRVRSLEGISQLQQLTYLNLAHNRLENVSRLTSLPALAEVDLRGNPRLACEGVQQLEARGIRVWAPEHCR